MEKKNILNLPCNEPARSTCIEAELMPIPLKIAYSRGYLLFQARLIQCESLFLWNCRYASDQSITLDEHKRLLSRIAINQCNKEYREQARIPSLPENFEEYLEEKEVDDLFGVIQTCLDEKHDQKVRNAFNKEVQECLKQIDPRARIVFEKVAIEGYTHKQVAQLIGEKPNNCQQLLFKARQSLKPIANKYYSLLIG